MYCVKLVPSPTYYTSDRVVTKAPPPLSAAFNPFPVDNEGRLIYFRFL